MGGSIGRRRIKVTSLQDWLKESIRICFAYFWEEKMPNSTAPKTQRPSPLQNFGNDDLVKEIKTRIANKELYETVLFDLNTGRIYSDLDTEDRRLLGTGAAMSIIFDDRL